MIDTNIFFYNQVYIIFMGIGAYAISMMNRITDVFSYENPEIYTEKKLESNIISIKSDSLLFPISELEPVNPSLLMYRKKLSKRKIRNK